MSSIHSNDLGSKSSGSATGGSGSGKVREEIEGFGEAARAAAEQARHKARAGFHEASEELREEGSRLTSAAADEAYRFAEGRKQAAADALQDLAQSVRDSANAFEDRPNLQAFFGSAAEGLDGFASTVHDRTFAQLYADAENAARRRPAMFAVGAGLVGLLLTRFARASGMRARLEEERYEAERRWDEQSRGAAQNKGRDND